ncbi:MAG: M67 family metallopeptidase [Chloroflexota bacterium]|nr:M67 family metallopeptidase [Chloroflexota bacterium]MDE2841415.1 M67 family metallopeptidase [Chloroflexota bacterium]MDE2929663.1 M67 family metallopeptidase [Chloroflexota bacterium]
MTAEQREEMIAHVRAEAPNEGCGMLGGKDGTVLAVFPARNAAASPIRFTIHPEDLLRIVRTVEYERDLQIVGIFHSHIASAAYPSATDVAEAEFDMGNGETVERYPGAMHIVISLANPTEPDVRGYTIRQGEIAEAPLCIVPDAV